MKAQLTQIVGSENSPSLMVPERLGQSLETLVSNRDKLNATVAIAKGLSPEDTQMFVDFLELVVADLGPYRNANLAYYLLVSIMKSSHVVPGFYKLSSGIRYDPTPLLVNGSLTSVHRGSDLKVLVHIAAPAMFRKDLFVNLPCWAYISDSNVLSFYGLFYEDAPESPRLCVVTPLWASRTLNDYIAEASQTSRMPLVLDIASGMIYLQKMNTVTQYETKGNILVSDQGRAVITCDFPVNLRLPRQSTYFRRFSAPFHRYDWADNVWTFGCLCYMILTCKEPYYQYTEEADIDSAVHRGELPRRPDGNKDDMDEIGDCAWSLINHCCQYWRRYRPTLEEAQRLVISWGIKDDRPSVDMSLETSLFVMRSRPFVNFNRVETLLGQIQIELLKSPLTKLLRNHMKDLVRATEGLKPDDIHALVDFLDLVLTDYLLKSEERNRALALLAKVTSTTHIFPHRHGSESSYSGHIYHIQTFLPFCGVLLNKVNGSQRICLVSPFMRNGNLNTYARHLSPRSRLALVITILDVANGLQHLHEFGIIHGDLKGENVLISNEGRCLITDFGTTHITTATATVTTSKFPTTLHYAAPEVVLNDDPPTREQDVWAFGCVCYETISRLPPYFQYRSVVQISVALARKEIPKWPGLAQNDAENGVNEDTLDFDKEAEECDKIDDQAWNLITTCCEPEPGSRPDISTIQQLIVDMKVWDDRPAPKTSFATEISKLREDQVISPDHIGELLSDLQKAVVSINEEDLEEDIDFQDLWYSDDNERYDPEMVANLDHDPFRVNVGNQATRATGGDDDGNNNQESRGKGTRDFDIGAFGDLAATTHESDSYPAAGMLYSPLPSPEQIRTDVIKRFKVHPCLYQIHNALAQFRGEDCITIAATGSGKTLTFWIPLLYLPKKAFIFLITALNILGDQNVKELEQYNFTAINLTAENCTDEVFKIRKLQTGTIKSLSSARNEF
ncbi:hypothetical protein NP233_g12754 [Leucocoprinus birnbaumii]|uniref:Protein kinase domain-containing protein n=1 Tax=Leucocoprinus birnbaumii TaxID=56174 RepID=A0AAD5VDU7_9AGAR|nr:hypothetical protein NP233_g12754 [Leucocoprinus birnbaumii]